MLISVMVGWMDRMALRVACARTLSDHPDLTVPEHARREHTILPPGCGSGGMTETRRGWPAGAIRQRAERLDDDLPSFSQAYRRRQGAAPSAYARAGATSGPAR